MSSMLIKLLGTSRVNVKMEEIVLEVRIKFSNLAAGLSAEFKKISFLLSRIRENRQRLVMFLKSGP